MDRARLKSIIIFLLIAITCAVYGQVSRFDFVHLDDFEYVVRSPILARGLSAPGIAMAFASPYQSAWMPLTWISFLLDHAIYGMNAGGYHVTNLLLHLLNTVLLFLFLSASTKAMWKSGLVAALFAIHPLHVESVAWVASRKDVLSAFFWMLSLVMYLRYLERRTLARYLPVAALFTAGLMAKPVVVTLPLVLLLLDYWPFKRFGQPCPGGAAGCGPNESIGSIVLEKIPLLVIAAASCLLTLNVWSITNLPLRDRLSNAPVACLTYVEKTLWPANLAFFYPHPEGGIDPAAAAVAAAALLLACAWTYARRGRYPHIFVGLLWYLVTLAPVMGIVQTGMHGLADRFTYIPLTGLFIAAVWGLFAAQQYEPRRSLALSGAALAVIACLCVCSWGQARLWRDTRPLCEHALAVTEQNYMAHNSLGAALESEGMPEDARRQYEAAIAIKPGFASAHRNLASLLMKERDFKAALEHLTIVAGLSPGDAEVLFLMGLAQEGLGDFQNARSQYLAAVTANPRLYTASNNLGVLYSRQGDFTQAIRCFTRAIEESPAYAPAYVNRARAYLQSGDDRSALADLEMVVAMMPDRMRAAQDLGAVLAQYGKQNLTSALYAAAERTAN